MTFKTFKSSLIIILFLLVNPNWCLGSLNEDCSNIESYLNQVLDKAKFSDKSNHPEIFTKIDEALNLNCDFEGKALTIRGILFYTAGNILKAKESYFAAEKLLSSQSNSEDYALNQLNLGLIYVLELNNENALICFDRSLRISEQLGNKFETADAYLNIGLVKLEMKEYEESEKNLNKAIEILNTIAIVPTHGYANYNLSRLYLTTSEHEKAISYNEKARDIWLSIENNKGLYFFARHQSDIYESLGETEKQISYLNKALEYSGDEGIKVASTNFNLGKAYLSIGNKSQAEKYLSRSVKDAQLADSDDLKFATNELFKIFAQRNDEKAISSLLNDVVNSFKINKDISKLTETKLLEKDIGVDTLNKLNQSLTAATNEIKRRSKVRLYLFSIAGILGLLTIVYITKLNRDKEKLFSKVKENNIKLNISNNELAKYSKTINRQNEMLESKNEDLKNFAYTASHDIKSPLNTIVGYADLLPTLIDNGENEKVKFFAHTIHKSCKRLTALVTDLLDYAKIDQKKLNIKEINTREFFEELSNSLQSELTSKQAILEVEESIPEQIYGDEIKLFQLFQNLVSNSIKFTKDGIKPRVKIWSVESKSLDYHIKVEDNGIGIPSENLDTIFNMFEKLHNDDQYAGTGIGLAVCQKVAMLHNGKLEVESKEGIGTTFTLHLPKSIIEGKTT